MGCLQGSCGYYGSWSCLSCGYWSSPNSGDLCCTDLKGKKAVHGISLCQIFPTLLTPPTSNLLAHFSPTTTHQESLIKKKKYTHQESCDLHPVFKLGDSEFHKLQEFCAYVFWNLNSTIGKVCFLLSFIAQIYHSIYSINVFLWKSLNLWGITNFFQFKFMNKCIFIQKMQWEKEMQLHFFLRF